MPRVIAIATQKGGVGKTTTTTNLAAAIVGQYALRAVVLDLDPQCDATALLLGPEAAMTPEWLAALDPRLVLISTEAGSGYPDAATLAQLAGRSVLRTDVNGTLTVETDGVQLWVRAER